MVSLLRRLSILAVAVLATVPPSALAAEILVQDVLGRKVVLPAAPQRILLGEGFLLQSLALLDRDPVKRLAGWGGDLKSIDPVVYEDYRAAFPALAELPVVGTGTGDSFSLEKALTVAPDLALFSAWQLPDGPADPMVKTLEAAGIPVVVVDFYKDPLRNTPLSIELLGTALGRDAEAKAYTAFYRERLAALHAKLAAGPLEHPSVMLHAYPGLWPCCWSAGAKGLGEFLTLLGAKNIGGDRFPSEHGGQLSLEYLLTQDPDIYIATGLAQLAQPGALTIGSGVPAEKARATLARVMETPGLAALGVMRTGRVHGLWNFFNGTPFNILGIEALAQWIQPKLFADLDPEADRETINRRFLPVPIRGSYWIDLVPGPRQK